MKKALVLMALVLFLGILPREAAAVPAAPVMTHAETGLSITISWTPATGAVGYLLCYAPYVPSGQIPLDTVGFLDMGTATELPLYLWEGAAYHIAVLAYDGQGNANLSNIGYFIMGPPTLTWVDNDADGFHENSGDCDDGNMSIHPEASEVCGDGIDQDCDDVDAICAPADIDNDRDGYTENQGDCNDTKATIHPMAEDYCGNGIDEDCSGADLACLPAPEEIDDDGDGFTEIHGDCDDGNAAVYPRATEICEDGLDQDCNGADQLCSQNIDDDNDGYTETQGDCNDSRADTHPGAVDACGDGIDQDCTGGDPLCAEIPSLTGAWTATHTIGSNNCNQPVGDTLQFNADVVQTGNTVTVTTADGSGSGTLNGNRATFTTTQPFTYGSLSGNLTITMNTTVAADGNSFSGPTSYRWSSGLLSCSGVGSIAGMRIQ